MKTLRIIGLGLVIWLLGLVWPQVYLWLTPQIMLAAVAVLSVVWLSQLWSNHHPVNQVMIQPVRATNKPNDSHPFKPIGLA